MEEKTTDKTILSFTLYTFIILVLAIISVAFSGAITYKEFQILQEEINDIDNDLENVNRRIDVKTKRNENRIKELEKSGSDKK